MASPDDVLPDGTWEMPEGEGPCFTWPLASSCHKFPDDVAEWDEKMFWAVEVATEILWRATAGRFGLCVETVRPCRRPPRITHRGAAGPVWQPDVVDGRWVNITCGCPSPDSCGCGGPFELKLPGPVQRDADHPITVTIDGAELPASAFTLYEPNLLVRTDGQPWPQRQRLTAPPNAEGTWAVTYYRGAPVPIGGRMAIATYAHHLWLWCTGSSECGLPIDRIRTINRYNVQYTLIDPRDFLDAGRTGLTMVDQWLVAVNPTAQRTPSAVFSPDDPRFRQARP